MTSRTQQLPELLKRRILILDGAMGTMIQNYKLDEAAYRGERFKDFAHDVKGNNDLLTLTQPQIIREIHEQYLDAGADIINDVWALRQAGAQQVVAAHAQCGVCLMHMHGEPQTMQALPMHGSSIQPVTEFLKTHAQALQALGVAHERIALDPGVGFGKTVAQNFELLAHQDQLLALGYPVLVGWSRKSSIGAVTGCEVGERMVPSVAAALLAVERGARIVRVHDVAQTVQALKVWQAAQV